MKRRLILVPLAFGFFACADQIVTGPTTANPNFEIADAARGYKAGFYWLPPMVKQPVFQGTFDPALSPTVDICELTAGVCGAVLATYTMTSGTGGDLVTVDVEGEHYQVSWHTNEFDLSATGLYRISVRAGIQDVLLGFADVQPVDNGSGLKDVDRDEYIALIDGRTLRIRLRIETGIVGLVEVQPVEAEAEPGATQQFMAILRDLHGNIMTDDVAWASSDGAVATVDQTGLATAVADGVATITATSERISGSATLTVEGGLVALSAGRGHACSIGSGGQAYCWGQGSFGQLGNGSTSNRLAPTAVSDGLTFAAIEAGDFHTCGVTTVGQAYCWGYNGQGQLGAGSISNNICEAVHPCRLTPVAVSGGLTFVSISAGLWHTCGITSEHQAYCWGEGFEGRLGNGSQTRHSTPQPVSGELAFASISASLSHTCGVTTAGQGYCWGNGASGKLGNGSTANRLIPVAVSNGLTFTSIIAGAGHTCGVTSSGEGYCWGLGLFGRLGNSSTASFSTPQPVSGGLVFAQISAGGIHTCGVTVAGIGYCWGGRIDGNLGDGGLSSRSTPSPVIGGHTWAYIIAGGHIGPTFSSSSQFSFTCGVTVEDQTYCWGSGFHGQLGNGSTSNRSTPTPVAAFP